jgi:hypothetical protein
MDGIFSFGAPHEQAVKTFALTAGFIWAQRQR